MLTFNAVFLYLMIKHFLGVYRVALQLFTFVVSLNIQGKVLRF